jgi:hypothetical protein
MKPPRRFSPQEYSGLHVMEREKSRENMLNLAADMIQLWYTLIDSGLGGVL